MTWTTAFAVTPVVVVAHIQGAGQVGASPYVVSRSTTGATVDSGDANGRLKMVMAQEAT